jgi:hypothetical protein
MGPPSRSERRNARLVKRTNVRRSTLTAAPLRLSIPTSTSRQHHPLTPYPFQQDDSASWQQLQHRQQLQQLQQQGYSIVEDVYESAFSQQGSSPKEQGSTSSQQVSSPAGNESASSLQALSPAEQVVREYVESHHTVDDDTVRALYA